MKTSKLRFLLLPWSLSLACAGDVSEIDTLGGSADGSTTGTATIDPSDTSGASNSLTDSMTASMSGSDTESTVDTSASVTDTDASSSGSASADSTSTAGESDTESGSTTSDSGETESDTDTGTGTTGNMSCMDDLACDDGLPCNGIETCLGGECVPGEAVACDDGVSCTVDECDDNDGSCNAIPVNASCSDGLFCNGVETCNPVTDCQPGTPIACNDGVACTDDACDEAANACAFVPNHGNCTDNTFCNGAETCDPVLGCQSDDDFSCADLVACTQDTCDESNDECVHTPDDGVCGDGVICNGEEVCNPANGCEAGTAIDCVDDGVACTVESCDEGIGGCDTELDNTACGAGEFCSSNGCVVGEPCDNAGDCQDGLACNGNEICAPSEPMGPNVCQSGPPIDCNDGIACTSDSCSEPGMCDNVPLNGLCSDGNPCDGSEVCVAGPGGGCQESAPLDCDDGVSCTTDLCINNFGCNNIADDAQCDDGVFCNGAESCHVTNDCQVANPIVCPDDGIACTDDYCDEQNNGCVHDPDDSQCGCGEECVPEIGGCGSDCNVALCDGHLYDCGDCADNDGDCGIDDHDTNCFGPCSDNESGLDGNIPGQDNAPCKHDCYWDGNSGAGDDDCYWSHECDPLEPSATTCEYSPNASIPGYPGNMDCTNAAMTQSAVCEAFCAELAPNGCDCFGCCAVDDGNGGSINVYLGSKVDGNGDSTCHADVLTDPNLCHPCTQVPACVNTCDQCEICFGDNDGLPPECGGEQVCPIGQQQCGQVGQEDCPEGEFCLTGCCQQF